MNRATRRVGPSRRLVAVVGVLAISMLAVPSASVAQTAESKAAVQADAAALEVPYAHDVRGNLYLPTSGENGSTILWSSSDPAVITPTGEVTRSAEGDVSVKLTAELTLDGASATREISAFVREQPPTEDLEGYAFPHMLGEGSSSGEQIYFALSVGNNPLQWTALNGHQPVLRSNIGEQGARDPMLIRSPEGDRFYLIATDLKIYGNGNWDRAQRHGSRSVLVWESTDMVNWSEERLLEVAPESAGNTWAPEIFYDETTGDYTIFWASSIYTNPAHTGTIRQRIMYVKTRDFRTVTAAQTYFDPGYAVIDTTMIKHGDQIFRFTKDERNASTSNPFGKHVFQEVGNSVLDPAWSLIKRGVGASSDPTIGIRRGEGPTVFKSNTEDKWFLFIDEYGLRGYVPFETTDLSSGEWTLVQGMSWPGRPRHGSVVPLTGLEHARLAATPPQECTQTLSGDVAGPLLVAEGVTCLNGATVADGVMVSDGASLVANGGRINGGVRASGASVISLNNVQVSGPTTLTGTTGWVKVTGSRLFGPVKMDDSAGAVAPDLSRSTVRGTLSCTGNTTEPVLTGTEVNGRTSGQCVL